jgi:hypothetical protein
MLFTVVSVASVIVRADAALSLNETIRSDLAKIENGS